MQIGISTLVKTKEENWDRMIKLVDEGFRSIEFYNKITRIRTEDVEQLLKLRKEKKLDYSLHSMCQDFYCNNMVIALGEYYSLLGEIELASLLKCDHVMFHITKKTKLNKTELKSLNKLSIFAKRKGVKLCLENNSSKGVFSSDYIIDILDKISNLWFCLDIGHYNISLNNGYIKNSDLFLSSIKKKLVEIHVSFNNGIKDQHLGYNKIYNQYFNKVIKNKDVINKKIIIEAKNYKQAVMTRDFLIELKNK